MRGIKYFLLEKDEQETEEARYWNSGYLQSVEDVSCLVFAFAEDWKMSLSCATLLRLKEKKVKENPLGIQIQLYVRIQIQLYMKKKKHKSKAIAS